MPRLPIKLGGQLFELGLTVLQVLPHYGLQLQCRLPSPALAGWHLPRQLLLSFLLQGRHCWWTQPDQHCSRVCCQMGLLQKRVMPAQKSFLPYAWLPFQTLAYLGKCIRTCPHSITFRQLWRHVCRWHTYVRDNKDSRLEGPDHISMLTTRAPSQEMNAQSAR